MGLSGCVKSSFTETLLLDHLEELFVSSPPTIHYCYGAWQDRFQTMKEAGVQFHEGVPIIFPFAKMVFEREFTRVRRFDGRGRGRQRVSRLVRVTFTSSKYHRIVVVPRQVSTGEIRQEYFQERPLRHSLQISKDQLGVINLLLQAFPTYWQDAMDMYQKVIKRPFRYMVLDLRPASDDRIRVSRHLLTHEGFLRCYLKKREQELVYQKVL